MEALLLVEHEGKVGCGAGWRSKYGLVLVRYACRCQIQASRKLCEKRTSLEVFPKWGLLQQVEKGKGMRKDDELCVLRLFPIKQVLQVGDEVRVIEVFILRQDLNGESCVRKKAGCN